VEGRLKLNKYTDRDGVERHSLDVDATELQMLGTRDGMGRPAEEANGSFGTREQGAGGGQRESSAGSRPGATRAPAGGSGARQGGGLGPEDDDIPF